MSNPRMYRSPGPAHAIIRVCHESRVVRLGADWRALRPEMHDAAVKAGAEVNTGTFRVGEVQVPARKPPPPAIGSDAAVRDGLICMLSRDEPDDFIEATGLPNLTVLSKLVGYEVGTSQAAKVLREMRAESDAAEKAAEKAAGKDGEKDGETDPTTEKVEARKAAVKKAVSKIVRKAKPPKSAQSA